MPPLDPTGNGTHADAELQEHQSPEHVKGYALPPMPGTATHSYYMRVETALSHAVGKDVHVFVRPGDQEGWVWMLGLPDSFLQRVRAKLAEKGSPATQTHASFSAVVDALTMHGGVAGAGMEASHQGHGEGQGQGQGQPQGGTPSFLAAMHLLGKMLAVDAVTARVTNTAYWNADNVTLRVQPDTARPGSPTPTAMPTPMCTPTPTANTTANANTMGGSGGAADTVGQIGVGGPGGVPERQHEGGGCVQSTGTDDSGGMGQSGKGTGPAGGASNDASSKWILLASNPNMATSLSRLKIAPRTGFEMCFAPGTDTCWGRGGGGTRCGSDFQTTHTFMIGSLQAGDAACGRPFHLGSTLNTHFHDCVAL